MQSLNWNILNNQKMNQKKVQVKNRLVLSVTQMFKVYLNSEGDLIKNLNQVVLSN